MAFVSESVASYFVPGNQVSSNRASSILENLSIIFKMECEVHRNESQQLPVSAVNPRHFRSKCRKQIVNCICYYHTVIGGQQKRYDDTCHAGT